METIVFFDTETTGVEASKDRIVQISFVKTDLSFRVLDKKKTLLNPGIPIPKSASDVHHILDSDVAASPTFKQVSKSLFDFLEGSILAGFNSDRFDLPLLSEEFSRCDLTFPIPGTKLRTLDSLKVFHEKEKRNLTAAYKFYCNGNLEGLAHDAENDVLATIEVLQGQMFMYDMTLEECEDMCKSENVDLAGKIVLLEGLPCYSFGKAKGIPVLKDPGFGEWMLKNDFTSNTKNVLRSILYSK